MKEYYKKVSDNFNSDNRSPSRIVEFPVGAGHRSSAEQKQQRYGCYSELFSTIAVSIHRDRKRYPFIIVTWNFPSLRRVRFSFMFSRSDHEGIALSFVGYRQTDFLSLFSLYSTRSLSVPSTIWLFLSFTDSNKFPATIVRFDIGRCHLHVVARFCTLCGMSRKNNFRFAAIEREKGSGEQRWTNLYVTVSATCFVWEASEADAAHRRPTDKTYWAIHHDLAIIWLSVSAQRWIKRRVSRCRCRGVFLQLVHLAREIWDESDTRCVRLRNLAWNYSPEIKFCQSYLWNLWSLRSNEKLF